MPCKQSPWHSAEVTSDTVQQPLITVLYKICTQSPVALTAGEAFGFEGLGETYLSMDIDNRVIRLDTFSKFLAPGVRLGWTTCHPDMLEKICFSLHASTIGPCSFTQVMIAEVLATWGPDGLVQHLKKMQVDYKKRAAIVQEAAGQLCSALCAASCTPARSCTAASSCVAAEDLALQQRICAAARSS